MDTAVTGLDWTGLGSPRLSSLSILTLRYFSFILLCLLDCDLLTLRRLMSYIYGAPILDVSRSHTTTQHSR